MAVFNGLLIHNKTRDDDDDAITDLDWGSEISVEENHSRTFLFLFITEVFELFFKAPTEVNKRDQTVKKKTADNKSNRNRLRHQTASLHGV